MIARLIRRLRELRAHHYHRVACAAGAQILQAQQRRDWPAAGAHLMRMHAAQAKRDRLHDRIAIEDARREARWLYEAGETRPTCCNYDCRQGRDCPLRA